ncbi:MAG: 2Fe-2S iron-sulfur cluster-binding protein [Steroidobacteraceae bacterium]
MYRLPQAVPGECIDRGRPLRMQFEGREIEAFEGDTLSSALAGAGLMVTARSFKYHRPRGIVSAAGHDANNLFQIGGEPNQRGDHVLARDGLAFSAVNTRGGVVQDRASFMGRLARFLPVGFYYKAFIGRHTFPWFERTIRAFSGLGAVDTAGAGRLRERHYAHCEVAVIGAGVAGLSAALAAVRAGARRVIVIDEAQRPGGSGLWHASSRAQHAAQCRDLIAAVHAAGAIQLLLSHSVVGCYADHELAIARIDREDGGLTLLRAAAVVLATGCIEQPAVFHNNDLPGVLLGSAAQRLLYTHGIGVGRRVAVLGANEESVALALDLASQGIRVQELVIPAGAPLQASAALVAQLRQAGVRLHDGAQRMAAQCGVDGALAALEWLGNDESRQRIDCDALLVSTGWTPALQLALQRGATMRFDATIGQHLPDRLPHGLFAAGRANGCFNFDARLADGASAGEQAARHAAGAGAIAATSAPRADRCHSHPLPLFPSAAGKEFVDLDEDLTLADLANAAQEGFDSVELMKRYSTVGMGPSQGKLSNLNAARQLAQVTGRELPTLGLTTARPPWQPVSLGALAGARVSPLRRTALDDWHAARGAVWMPAGTWRRPAHYGGSASQGRAAIAREAAAVRHAAGLIDVSTLGKIEVMGPDAGELLERMYVGFASNLAPGRTRYAVMLDEAGTVIDDGVLMRLADGRFYVTTTTSGSAAIYRELQRRVAEWQLDCTLHNLTGHMAAMNLAGPRSRSILAQCTELSLDDAAFPYLALREGLVAGAMARVTRAGFVGELGYEIHVPFDAALAVWDALMQAGAVAGLLPFGVEAQRLLRLEKGHIIIGQDTDGVTNAFEAGLERLLRLDKPFFIGQRSLAILKQRGDKQRLIGFRLEDPAAPLCEAHLAIEDGQIAGRITSIGWSEVLQQTIGLALLTPRAAVAGARAQFRDDSGALHRAQLVAPPFYDPQNLRQQPELA